MATAIGSGPALIYRGGTRALRSTGVTVWAVSLSQERQHTLRGRQMDFAGGRGPLVADGAERLEAPAYSSGISGRLPRGSTTFPLASFSQASSGTTGQILRTSPLTATTSSLILGRWAI